MKIALIGTGLLGNAMGERLLQSGMSLTVYNRTREKTASLQQAGAQVAATAAEAIRHSDYVILMLSDAAAIRETLLAASAVQFRGQQIVQMGTIAPEQSRQLADEFTAAGGIYSEAPVLGSLPEARSGTLICMFGGTEENFTHCLPLLSVLSETPVLVGEVGQAAAMKLALNQLIASLTCGFSQSLAWVEKQGLPQDLFMELLRGSALYAPTFDKKLERMQNRHFSKPNFPTRHLLKDVELFIESAAPLGIETGILSAIRSRLQETVAEGLGEADYSAIHHTIADHEEQA